MTSSIPKLNVAFSCDAINIRQANLSDAAGINAIQTFYITNTTKTVWYTPFTVEETRQKMATAIGEGYPFFVVESSHGDRSVLGYASLSKFRPQDGWSSTAELSLFVHHRHRGEGLGGLLLRKLQDAAKGSGQPSVDGNATAPTQKMRQLKSIMAIVADDEEKLANFYTHHGFNLVGVMQDCATENGKW